ELALLSLTFRHRAGVRPYTSPYGFAEPCVFNKQSLPPGLCHPNLVAQARSPFFRSYGSNLPSSFNTVLSSALVCSTSPPVSVWGTVCTLGLFPGSPRPHTQSSKRARLSAFVTSQQAHEY